MKVRLTPVKLCGSIPAISSKSDAHRLLIAAALSDRETEILCNVLSEDIRATARCLCALGARVDFLADRMLVHPIPRENTAKEVSVTLDCGESGSTLRFLLPVVSALGKNGVFTGGGRLPERPVTELREAMEAHGVRFSEQGVFPISTIGKLGIGTYTLRGDVSSQYVTGLLFALPLLSDDSTLRLLPPVESAPYIEMTLSSLMRFGIEVRREGHTYFIKGNQTYRSPGAVSVEGDWSNAAFFLTAGALGAPITVTGLNPDSPQGDKAILDILRRMGANVETTGGWIASTLQDDSDEALIEALQRRKAKKSEPTEGIATVSPGRLCGIAQDMADIPDLAPIFSVAAAAARTGETAIQNAARLRLKESDRLAAIHRMLGSLGVSCTETADGLLIPGGQSISGGETSGFGDHRMVMAAAIASVLAETPVTIDGAEAVEKSYPHFFEDFKRLGGMVDVLDPAR